MRIATMRKATIQKVEDGVHKIDQLVTFLFVSAHLTYS